MSPAAGFKKWAGRRKFRYVKELRGRTAIYSLPAQIVSIVMDALKRFEQSLRAGRG